MVKKVLEENNINTNELEVTSCYTCSLVQDTSDNTLVVYKSSNVIVNHHSLDNPKQNRTGWFIASPTRHMCRFFELNENENNELNTVIKTMDEALTAILGAKESLSPR